MKPNARFDFVFITIDDRARFLEYVELRRRAYSEEYRWLPAEFGTEDETDCHSLIAVALSGGAVAAGARLTISSPHDNQLLPLEEGGFRLKDYLPTREFRLDINPYGEISRMAVDPSLARGFEGSAGVGDMLCGAAARLGLDVVFSICPEKPARINAMNARRRGVPFRRYEELETVFGVEMWLCAFSGLRSAYSAGHRSAA
ncbi:MAG TPA: hypothetical protein VKB79_00335 [Bryobacteraceae bacterium]|nr:hypothetical protein [Bryobacteraceae bacterium]